MRGFAIVAIVIAMVLINTVTGKPHQMDMERDFEAKREIGEYCFGVWCPEGSTCTPYFI